MTDTSTPRSANGAAASPDQNVQPGIRILAQFIRDLSFENPRAPESLRGGAEAPQIELGVELSAQAPRGRRVPGRSQDDRSAQAPGRTVFQIEIVYGGLFQVVGVSRRTWSRC